MMVGKTFKNVWMILSTRCDEASRLISHGQEKPLRGAEKWALRMHLLVCGMCRNYRRQLKLMRAVLARLADAALYERSEGVDLDAEQSRAMRGRITRKIRENLESM